ncbi:MAG TPA: formyltransferase family protein, partial [Anaerolineales bacterium]|nr:formyltransferase family protein [Anaerolineales bacterium]
AYRGPEPLFWQFYYGEARTGVTLHFMDEKADTGDIVSQAEVRFPDGISLAHAETLTAQAGGDLICRALAQPDQLPRIPQSEQGASYHPRPTSDDLIIPTTWTARRAFNFLRAARDWGPFEIVDQTRQRLRVREAVGLVESLGAANLPGPDKGETWVQFNDGLLRVRVG